MMPSKLDRVVITGVGLTSPLGNDMNSLRQGLLAGECGLSAFETRYMGNVVAGQCDFDEFAYQKRRSRRRGTRAGSIAIHCANEALNNAGVNIHDQLQLQKLGLNKNRLGIYLGITEHGNVETESEVDRLIHEYEKDVGLWSIHHNPRTVANSPAGEVALNLGVTGPHYCIGAACAAGNLGPIQGMQMLQLGEVDMALAGGVSESIHTFGVFAAFHSQSALGYHEDPTLATRPLDVDRQGIVVSEGGCIFVLERLQSALARGANIIAEIIGHACNTDATDFVLPNCERQIQCMQLAMKRADLTPEQIHIVSLHATGTKQGDAVECEAVGSVFNKQNDSHSNSRGTIINASKANIGHAMGAAGALELAGNLPSFWDRQIHGHRPIKNLDPKCALPGLLNGETLRDQEVKVILNNSFGMLGINSVLIVKKYEEEEVGSNS